MSGQHQSGGLEYQEFSHIVPPLRLVTIAYGAPGIAVPVPGAENGDVLLGVTAVVDAPPSDLLGEATFADGDITLSTTDIGGSTLLILYWDKNGVMT